MLDLPTPTLPTGVDEKEFKATVIAITAATVKKREGFVERNHRRKFLTQMGVALDDMGFPIKTFNEINKRMRDLD